MNCTEIRPTWVRKASRKQVKWIISLAWQLRPYYFYDQWQEIREGLMQLLTLPTMHGCHRLIERMRFALKEKQAQNARKVWIPMNYRVSNPAWQKNILKMACSLFSDHADFFMKLDSKNLSAWKSLKNSVERRELFHSKMVIHDSSENDTRCAEVEAERWQCNQRPYSELIEGIDWLEPTPGIDEATAEFASK